MYPSSFEIARRCSGPESQPCVLSDIAALPQGPNRRLLATGIRERVSSVATFRPWRPLHSIDRRARTPTIARRKTYDVSLPASMIKGVGSSGFVAGGMN
jgi:hypothetical protein